MATSGIGDVTKTAFQVFLFLLWLASLGVLGVSAWLMADDIVSTGMRSEFGLGWFYTPVHLLIASSVFGIIGGILGCIGTWRGNRVLLLIFCAVLFLVTTLSFTAGGLSYHYRFEVMNVQFSDYVEDSLVGALAGDKLDNRPVELQAAVKRAQERFLCCGLTFSDNWRDACSDETCRNTYLDYCTPYPPCRLKFDDIVVQYLMYVFAVAFTHGGIQFIGLLLVLYMVRRLGGGKKKKEKRRQEAEMEKMQTT
ncbi:tetraspanin-8-like [Branchiostoma lanceolatum]|uniref:CD151 protein n=1 Tax=Branchiostoma lanceolatum TaxID=7740 RepID=A0A8J9ZMJ9_BRALA|nr:CD151 [Branchiostoma lanceolatum]